jgi:HEAT repeat protein
MKRLFCVCLVLVLSGCNPEPAFRGRPLHVWRQELKHKDATARCRAAAVFAVVRPPVQEVIPDLIECLHDSEHLVRSEAAVALGQMGPSARSAVPALTKLLKDPVLHVRDAAAEALKKIDAERDSPTTPPAVPSRST